MADHILNISTEVTPPKKFAVDDQEYDLLSFDHLSPEKEAAALAEFTRFAQTDAALSRASSDGNAERLAKKLRERRIKLITMLTTLPKDVASTIPLDGQLAIFKAVQAETGREDVDALIAEGNQPDVDAVLRD